MANTTVGALNVKISADTSGLKRGLKKTDSLLDKNSKKLNQNAKLWERWSLASAAGALALSASLTITTRKIIGLADSFTSIQNQIRQTTSTTEELTTRTDELLAVANRSRTEFAATAELYTQLNLSTENLNLSTDELLRLTETIGKSFSVSGKSAAESSGAIRQLGQAFSSGALRGDEFNSIAEGAPEIMRALQRSLKMTQGELRAFAATGGITSEVLVDALGGAADVIDQKLNNSVKTLAQSMQEAESNATSFIGKSGLVSGAMTGAGDAVVFLSKNLDVLSNIVAGLAAVYGANLVSKVVAATVAKVASSKASTVLIIKERELAAQALITARAEQAAAVGMFQAATGKTKSAIASGQLTAANTALATATMRASAANTAFAASATASGVAVTALKGGLALLGGPVGVLALAAGALAIFATGESDAEIETKELTKSVNDQIAALDNLGKTQKDLAGDKLSAVQDKMKEVNDQIASYEAMIVDATTSTRVAGSGFLALSSRIGDARDRLKELTQQEADLKRLVKAVDAAASGGGGINLEAEKELQGEIKDDDDLEKLTREAEQAQWFHLLGENQKKESNKRKAEAQLTADEAELEQIIAHNLAKITAAEDAAAKFAADEEKRRQKTIADIDIQIADDLEREKLLHKEAMERLQQTFLDEANLTAEEKARKEDMERQHQKRLTDIQEAEERRRNYLIAGAWAAAAQVVSIGGKKVQKITQTLAVVGAVIKGKQAAVDAYQSGMSIGGPWAPLAAAAYAAASIATTAGMINDIKRGGSSQSGGGGGGGGLPSIPSQPTPSGSTEQESSRTIDVNFTGEGLLSTDQVRALLGQIDDQLGDGVTLNNRG